MWFQHVPTEKFNHVVPFPIFFTLRSCTALVQPVEEVQMRRLSEMPYKTGTHYSKVWGEPLGAVSKKTEVDNCPIQKIEYLKDSERFSFADSSDVFCPRFMATALSAPYHSVGLQTAQVRAE